MQDASDCVMRLQRFEFSISWFKYHLMKSLIRLRTNAGGAPNTCKSNGAVFSEVFGWKRVQLSGERVSNTWATCLSVGDNIWKRMLIPHKTTVSHGTGVKDLSAERWARVRLARWWGNGPPWRRSVAGLRGWTATLGLRHGPDSYGRQQWGNCTMGETLMQQRRVRMTVFGL